MKLKRQWRKTAHGVVCRLGDGFYQRITGAPVALGNTELSKAAALYGWLLANVESGDFAAEWEHGAPIDQLSYDACAR